MTIKRYEVAVNYDDREPFRERNDGEWIRYEDYEAERSAMCEANSNAVLADVRAELLHDAIGLLMNHEQHENEGWRKDYEELIAKYSEHFS